MAATAGWIVGSRGQLCPEAPRRWPASELAPGSGVGSVCGSGVGVGRVPSPVSAYLAYGFEVAES